MPDFTSGVFLGRPKHVRRLSLVQLEASAVGLEQAAVRVSKAGVAEVKRKAGPGHQTPRLIVITEAVWCRLTGGAEPEPLPAETLARGGVSTLEPFPSARFLTASPWRRRMARVRGRSRC